MRIGHTRFTPTGVAGQAQATQREEFGSTATRRTSGERVRSGPGHKRHCPGLAARVLRALKHHDPVADRDTRGSQSKCGSKAGGRVAGAMSFVPRSSGTVRAGSIGIELEPRRTKRRAFNDPGHAHEFTFTAHRRTVVFNDDSACGVFLESLERVRRD